MLYLASAHRGPSELAANLLSFVSAQLVSPFGLSIRTLYHSCSRLVYGHRASGLVANEPVHSIAMRQCRCCCRLSKTNVSLRRIGSVGGLEWEIATREVSPTSVPSLGVSGALSAPIERDVWLSSWFRRVASSSIQVSKRVFRGP